MIKMMNGTRRHVALCFLLVAACGTVTRGEEPVSRNIVQTADAAGQFKTLIAAAKAAGLAEVLSGDGPFTVFAPTDDAFGKLPDGTVEGLLKDPDKLRDILLFHVVPGKFPAADVVKLNRAKTALGQFAAIDTSSGVKIEGAKVIKTDISASNGVIHVIDSVIIPRNDIIQAAKAAGSFKTLLTAIDTAGLTDTLRSAGPFTVFAPTDEAFARLPKGTLEQLLADKEKLASILTYHVVPGKVMAADVVKLKMAKTVQGQSVSISSLKDVVMIDKAKVLKTDVSATNGVIHVIDSVMLPPVVKIGAVSPRINRTLRMAIDRGVPLFNHGNEAACAVVYEVTAMNILELAGDEVSGADRARLEQGLREARHAGGVSDAAWALRRAFDEILMADSEMISLSASH